MTQTIQKKAVFQALGYAWQFGYTVVVPLVVLTIGGRLLDRKLGTSPWLLLTGVLVSMVVSSIGLTRKALLIMRDAEKASNETEKEEKHTPSSSS